MTQMSFFVVVLQSIFSGVAFRVVALIILFYIYINIYFLPVAKAVCKAVFFAATHTKKHTHTHRYIHTGLWFYSLVFLLLFFNDAV